MAQRRQPKAYAEATRFLGGIDRDWARAIEAIGPCTHDPKAAREPYEALIRAVAYQQLTAKAGDAIIHRLCVLHGDVFPSSTALAATADAELRGCGFSHSKVGTLKAIAAGVENGLIPGGRAARALSDEDLIASLTSIKGVGRWTVEMLLMYSLERSDILPADDFGVRDGYRRLKQLNDKPTSRVLRELSAAWSPYRTVASWYLWRIPK